jgi:Na+-transporting methylmalonyl-CoA/oxaloacetate decarboxylase gamma subunit
MLMDDLIKMVRSGFSKIPDHRELEKGNIQYSMEDCLSTAHSMFSLKDPTVAAYREAYPNRKENLKRVYGIERVPGDTSMRETLDGLDYNHLQDGFKPFLEVLSEKGVLESRLVLGNYLLFSSDGTGHYCSGKVSCKHCLTKELSNGDIQYHHQLLAAVNVHPNKKEVFPIAVCPIINEDGCVKNDCELNASKRLLPQVRSMLPNHKLLGLFDALYANGPHIKLLKKQDMSYIIGIKNGHAYELAKEFKKEGFLHEVEWEKDGKHCKVCYWNGFTLNMSHPNVLVNYFDYTETNQKTGEVYFSSWITDITINEEIVAELVTVARSRWKVENETFNTLKNQGYHLEHNYGHGKYNLATNFAILTFLAFLIDQMAQCFDSFFQAAWKEKKTKKGLWSKVREIFNLLPVASMNAIYRFISEKRQIDYPLII